tara:strand:+ start:1830 stop:1982 length:153 start_codon:yes stop_codon:yes gene_type:complete
MLYSIGIGLRNGWLVVKWSQLLHEVGFTNVDPKKPLDWQEFILERFESDK